jgi:hypothetical protein
MRCFILALLATALAAGEHHHPAAHGGSLHVIGSCDHGHAEVVVEGRRLRLWFVGGGAHSATAVRVPDAAITLTVPAADGAPERTLELKAKPLALAEEKPGDCSYFEGEADWLAQAAAFTASATVTFRGVKTPFSIAWRRAAEAR